MYHSNHFQQSIELESYPTKAKELVKEHGLLEIYDSKNSFIQEFIEHEIIAYDTRKINLDEQISAIVKVLSEWKNLLKSLKKAISNETISFEHLDEKVLFLLGKLSNKVFSNDTSDYEQYLVQAIREIWMISLTLDFSKLERLNPNEINYAILILNEEKTKFSFQIKNNDSHFTDLIDLAIKRLEFIKESALQNVKIIVSKKSKKPTKEPLLFKDFLQNISQKQLINCFISNQICTPDGKFIFQKGGRNPYPSPILLIYLPEILAELNLFDLSLWEKLTNRDKILILSQTFGIKNHPSFYTNIEIHRKNPFEAKLLQFSNQIKNALLSTSKPNF